jgi:hypothetical protein
MDFMTFLLKVKTIALFCLAGTAPHPALDMNEWRICMDRALEAEEPEPKMSFVR